jgi:hypothetical protein
MRKKKFSELKRHNNIISENKVRDVRRRKKKEIILYLSRKCNTLFTY